MINSVLCIWEDRLKPGKDRTDGVRQGLGLVIIEPACLFSQLRTFFGQSDIFKGKMGCEKILG